MMKLNIFDYLLEAQQLLSETRTELSTHIIHSRVWCQHSKLPKLYCIRIFA